MASGLEDFTLILCNDDPAKAAIAVKETQEGDWIWLPRSHIDYAEVPGKPGYVEVTMPQWLAEEKKLV